METRAGGRLDPKQSGMDQTNASGLKSVKNCQRVFDALLGLYPPGHHLHDWLSGEVPKWSWLGRAIYDWGIFVESQGKRCPRLHDRKLLRLWCTWEDAFPGKKFNKFHGAFCCMRRCVRHFHMAGRISEESNEAYNAKLAQIKSRLKRMHSNTQRVKKITQRAQGNLKAEVLQSRLDIQKKCTGKKRGKYAPRAHQSDTMSICFKPGTVTVIGGVRYVVLVSGNLLPEVWADLYEWFLGGKAPKDWLD